MFLCLTAFALIRVSKKQLSVCFLMGCDIQREWTLEYFLSQGCNFSLLCSLFITCEWVSGVEIFASSNWNVSAPVNRAICFVETMEFIRSKTQQYSRELTTCQARFGCFTQKVFATERLVLHVDMRLQSWRRIAFYKFVKCVKERVWVPRLWTLRRIWRVFNSPYGK